MCESVRQKLGHTIVCVGWEIEGYIAQWGQNHYKIEFEKRKILSRFYLQKIFQTENIKKFISEDVQIFQGLIENNLQKLCLILCSSNSNCERQLGIQMRSTIKPRFLRGFLSIFNFNYNFRTLLNPLCIKGGKIQTVKYMKFH